MSHRHKSLTAQNRREDDYTCSDRQSGTRPAISTLPVLYTRRVVLLCVVLLSPHHTACATPSSSGQGPFNPFPQLRIPPRIASLPNKFCSGTTRINNGSRRKEMAFIRSRRRETLNCSKASWKQNCESWISSSFYYGIGEELLRRGHPSSEQPHATEERNDSEYTNRMEDTSTLDSSKYMEDEGFAQDAFISFNEEGSNGMALFRETLKEFRKATNGIREDLALLRREIIELQKLQRRSLIHSQQEEDEENEYYEDEEEDEHAASRRATSARRQRRKMFDRLALSVENWATQLLKEEGKEEHGWKMVECNKMLRRKYNAEGTTKCYLKVRESVKTHR